MSTASRFAAGQDLERLRREWDDNVSPVPAATVPALLARLAAEAPDTIAIEDGDEAVTYAGLGARADKLAWRLAEHGIRPGDTVAVLMGRSADLLVAFIAVAKTGAAFVPLEARDPLPRMRAAVAGTGCALLLVDATTQGHEITAGITVIRADAVLRDAGPQAVPFADRTPDPDALFYIIHTSGSTGAPKGVGVSHRNLIAFALDRVWQSGGTQRVLFHSPPAFDASTYDIWVPLLSGGTVVVAPGRVDAAMLRRLIAERGITSVLLISGLFGALADGDPTCFGGLREVWTGGDVVPPAAVERVLAACPDLAVYAAYGPTEATTIATRHLVPRGRVAGAGVPIGQPMDNTRIYVLDGRLRLLPPGEAGELYIGGIGVARGYVNQPGRTAQRFLADPFGAAGTRMYATGDLARREDDGTYSFLGRVDDQVKIRGFRIELGEIEAVLTGHPGVSRAVVVVRKDHDGSGQLSAFAVPADPGGGADPEQLRSYLADRLPAHMVPAQVAIRDSLPLTGHDKVDRAKLLAESEQALSQAPAGPASQPQAGPPAAPGGPPAAASAGDTALGNTAPGDIALGDIEARVRDLWKEILGIEDIGRDENFFDRGGNSLRLIGLHARLCRTFAVDLPVQLLFEVSTIGAIARHLRDLKAPDAAWAGRPGSPSAGPGQPPASPASELAARAAARRDRIRARKDLR
jgi:amino acid adenylation domain-containing protein